MTQKVSAGRERPAPLLGAILLVLAGLAWLTTYAPAGTATSISLAAMAAVALAGAGVVVLLLALVLRRRR